MIVLLVVGWVLCVAWVIRFTLAQPRSGVGLVVAYMLSTSFLYCGFIAYLNPAYAHDRPGGDLYLMSYAFTKETVVVGTLASLLGLFGFALGAFLFQKFSSSIAPPALARPVNIAQARNFVVQLALFGFLGFLLTGRGLQIPLLDAVLQVARNSAVVTICLGATVALVTRGSYRMWAVAAASIPIAYLVLFGFMSYGFIVLTCFLGYWLLVLREQGPSYSRLLFGGLAGSYLLLSAFLTWMGSRDELRSILWRGAGIGERLSATWSAIAGLRPLNPVSLEHLDLLMTRLNQFVFVGKVIEQHHIVPQLRLYGESLLIALFAWIPRFLWAGKPEMGGSEFMAQHTGIAFSSFAAFGTGPILEFYANFGWIGIFLGMMALGLGVAWLDRKSAAALYDGRLLDFAKWFTAGLAFVAPLTSFFFMINTAVMSYLTLTLIAVALRPRRRPNPDSQ